MITPYFDRDGITLYQGDCLQIMPQLEPGSIDVVVTDPPYPDYHTDKWSTTPIDFLSKFDCRQLIFWSAKSEFPLSFCAVHIWDKLTGAASEYERIFERNGQNNYKVFRSYFINSTVAANYTGDTFYNHPSQKPIKLMIKIINQFTSKGLSILDPFMGSGTTGVACVQTGRRFVGIEIDEKYCAIAQKRIEQALLQPRLFDLEPKAKPKQGGLDL